MSNTKLRKVGGSVMLTIPPALLDELSLQPGSTVGIAVDQGNLVVTPIRRSKYTIEALLAESDYSQSQSPEEREWVDSPAVGSEPL